MAPLGNVPFLILDQEAGNTESLGSAPNVSRRSRVTGPQKGIDKLRIRRRAFLRAKYRKRREVRSAAEVAERLLW